MDRTAAIDYLASIVPELRMLAVSAHLPLVAYLLSGVERELEIERAPLGVVPDPDDLHDPAD